MENKSKKNRNFYIIIAALVITSIAYRVIAGIDFEQTSLLFIGLPALLSILMINYSERPKSLFGVVFKSITLFLLLSGILLGEGIICILMSAPIFYGVGALLTLIYHYFTKDGTNQKLYTIAVIPLLIVIGQPMDNYKPKELISIESHLVMDTAIGLEAFSTTPSLNRELPTFLNLGFPKPVQISSEGNQLNDQITIQFVSTTKGIGSLVLKIAEKSSNHILFNVVSDDTHISHWMQWEEMLVHLDTDVNGQKNITWTSKFYCDLGPSWYFEYLEKYAVGLMNDYLLDIYFNPATK